MIFAPNHESSLDAALLAAALPYQTLRHTHWAARKGRVTPNPVVRLLSRTARAVPVDRNTSALAAGAAVLQREGNLVWFPEGTRSRDGDLQDFKYGVGALALHFKVPIVPVAIEGSFEALPPEAWFPRLFSKISVRFGDAILPEEISSEDGRPAYECVAAKLRERVQELLD